VFRRSGRFKCGSKDFERSLAGSAAPRFKFDSSNKPKVAYVDDVAGAAQASVAISLVDLMNKSLLQAGSHFAQRLTLLISTFSIRS